MRLTNDRSVIAGMGVAATLVMAAVVSFILAGTLLTFHAWPTLGDSSDRPLIIPSSFGAPQTVARVVAPSPPRPTVRVAAASAPAPAPAAGGPVAAPRPVANEPAPPFSANSGAGNAQTPATTVPSRRNPTPPPSPPSGPVQQIQQTVEQTTQQTTSTLSNVTQGSTAALGDTVRAAGSGLGNVVSGVSPTLGQTVTGVGNIAGGTITGVGKLVGGLLSPHS